MTTTPQHDKLATLLAANPNAAEVARLLLDSGNWRLVNGDGRPKDIDVDATALIAELLGIDVEAYQTERLSALHATIAAGNVSTLATAAEEAETAADPDEENASGSEPADESESDEEPVRFPPTPVAPVLIADQVDGGDDEQPSAEGTEAANTEDTSDTGADD